MFREFAPRPAGDRGRTMRGDLIQTSLHTQLVGADAELHIVMILASGFVAETGAALAPGDIASVRISGLGEVRAEVHWSMGERIGFRFANPLTLDQLKRLA